MDVDLPSSSDLNQGAQPSPLTPNSGPTANHLQADLDPTDPIPDRRPSVTADVSRDLQALDLSADPPATGPNVARVEEKILLTTTPLQWLGPKYQPGESLVGHLETFKDFLRGIPENLITFQAPRLFLESLTPGAQEIARMAGKKATWEEMKDELVKNYATSDNTKLAWMAEINNLHQGSMSNEDFIARILRAQREFRDNHVLNEPELELAETHCITAFLTRGSRKLMSQTSKLKKQWKNKNYKATLFDYARELNQWSATERILNHWDRREQNNNSKEPVFQVQDFGSQRQGQSSRTPYTKSYKANPNYSDRHQRNFPPAFKDKKDRFNDQRSRSRSPGVDRYRRHDRSTPQGSMICRHDPNCNRVDCKYDHPSGHAFRSKEREERRRAKEIKCGRCGVAGHVVQQCSA
jgi:hypothetical protein